MTIIPSKLPHSPHQHFHHRKIGDAPPPGSYVLPGGCGVFLVGNAYRLARVAVGHPCADDSVWVEMTQKREKVPWLSNRHRRIAVAGLQKGHSIFTDEEADLMVGWIAETPAFKEPAE